MVCYLMRIIALFTCPFCYGPEFPGVFAGQSTVLLSRNSCNVRKLIVRQKAGELCATKNVHEDWESVILL